MRPVETIPGMEGVGIMENDGGVNSTIINCKKLHNITMYSHSDSNKNKV
jgi:hypothetical protein